MTGFGNFFGSVHSDRCTRSVFGHALSLLKKGDSSFKVVEGKVYDKDDERMIDFGDPEMVEAMVNHFWIEKDGRILDGVSDLMPFPKGRMAYLKRKEYDPVEFLLTTPVEKTPG